MSAPVRIQRERTRGWRTPANTVYVGRPTRWGNPFPLDVYPSERAVDLYRRWLLGPMSMDELSKLSVCIDDSPVRLKRWVLEHAVKVLAGHNLSCWCRLNYPCHAEVLLEIANR